MGGFKLVPLLESGRRSAAKRILVSFEVKVVTSACYCLGVSVLTVVNKHKAKFLADYLKS